MAEIPELVREFVDMSKAYLKQETVEPARRLGRFAGFAIGAAFAFALAALFAGIALLRLLADLLPDGPYWTVLSYVLAGLGLAAMAGIVVAATKTRLDKRREIV